jgi:O-antigen/teichoic acid export membrane protein
MPKRTLFTEIAAYLPATFIPMAVGLAAALIYPRLLSPSIYGGYVLGLGSATIASQVLGDWLGNSALRLFPEDKQTGEAHVFLASLFLCIGVTLVPALALMTALLAIAHKWSYIGPALALVVVTIPMKSMCSLLRAELRTRFYVALTSVGAAAGLGSGLGFYLITQKPELILVGPALVALIQIVIIAASNSTGKVVLQSFSTGPSLAKVRSILRFGLPVAITGLAAQSLLLADRFMVAIFRGDAEAGLYAANYSLGEKAATLGFGPLMGAMYPLIVNAWTEERRDEVISLLSRTGGLYLYYCIPVLAVLAAASYPLSKWLFRPQYAVAHSVIPLVALGTVLWNYGILFHQGLELAKRTIVIAAMVTGAAVCNMALNLLLIPPFGYMGAAWATLASYALYCLAARYWTVKLVGFRWRPSFMPLSE